MSLPRHYPSFVALIACAFVLPPTSARADDKTACLPAYEAGQKLRLDGRLNEARAQLIACAQSTCPLQVKTDCTQWLGEIEATLPSVVFAATDDHGNDVVDVRVWMDGVVLAE